jgi:hypothetical protein
MLCGTCRVTSRAGKQPCLTSRAAGEACLHCDQSDGKKSLQLLPLTHFGHVWETVTFRSGSNSISERILTGLDAVRFIEYIYIYIFQPDDGRTTETCRYICISNISSYDIKVA